MSATTDISTPSAMQLHYRSMHNVTIEFAGEDLELVEQACRELAERARREADVVKGTSVEPANKYAQRRFLGMAERLRAAQHPERPQADLRVLKRNVLEALASTDASEGEQLFDACAAARKS